MRPLYAELAKVLRDVGTPLFGVAGDSNLLMVDEFVRADGHYVAVTNEGSAVLMAAGFASVGGQVGLATITQGAVTNTVTALTFAARSHLPLVLLAGETPDWDRDNVQYVNVGAVARASEADYFRIVDAREASAVLSVAFERARRDRVPVVVGIPSDVMLVPVALEPIEIRSDPAVPTHPDSLRRTAEAMANSRRPLILAGRGVVEEGSGAEIVRLAKATGSRLATTLRAKGLFDGEEGDLGVLGGLQRTDSTAYFNGCDLIVAFGASLNTYTTSQGAALVGKRVVQVERNAASVAADEYVVGRAGGVARALVDLISPLDALRQPWSLAEQTSGPQDRSIVARVGKVDYDTALDTIEALLPKDRLLTVDGGRTFFEGVSRLSVSSPSDYIHTMSTGSIGLGVALAMGAWHAAPDRLSVLVTGDGGLMLGGLAELTTADRVDAKLIVFVMNDGCYGAEHHQLTQHGLSPDISYFKWPAFGPLADCLGGLGISVQSLDELDEVRTALRGDEWPIVVDVALDPETIPMDFTRERVGS